MAAIHKMPFDCTCLFRANLIKSTNVIGETKKRVTALTYSLYATTKTGDNVHHIERYT